MRRVKHTAPGKGSEKCVCAAENEKPQHYRFTTSFRLSRDTHIHDIAAQHTPLATHPITRNNGNSCTINNNTV